MSRKLKPKKLSFEPGDVLTQEDLAKRWGLAPRTIANWRWAKRGPKYFRAGNRALYRAEDVLKFETRGNK